VKKNIMEKKVSDRDIYIGKNRIYLDEDNIIYAIIDGEIDEKTAIMGKESSIKLLDMTEGQVNVIMDLNNARKPSFNARKTFSGMSEHKKIKKIALIGLHPVAKLLASFFMGKVKKKNMRFFKTKEDALAWIKDD
jgi:hypothetical protein